MEIKCEIFPKNIEKTVLTFKLSFFKVCAEYMETFPQNKQNQFNV